MGRRTLVAKPYLEQLLRSGGFVRIAGVDEVGMGPLAGPVVAAAVVLPIDADPLPVADSKRLTADERVWLAAAIRARALAVGIGAVSPAEIDRLNVYQAGLESMRRAIAALPALPDYVVVDGRAIPQLSIPQTHYAGADGFVYSVAAASIVAKVHRDALMSRLDGFFPQYGFRRHVGYATPEHLLALRQYGPTPLHRRSFAPCSGAPHGAGSGPGPGRV